MFLVELEGNCTNYILKVSTIKVIFP